MVKPYTPQLADIVWLDFDPQSGKEIMKRRPAIILTPIYFNKTTGLCFVCPITSTVRHQPYEVEVTIEGQKGAILTQQLKSVDWRQRRADFICNAPKIVLCSVRERLSTLLLEED